MLNHPLRSRRKRRRLRLRLLALAGLGAFALAGCVSKGDFEQVQRERDLLQASNESLKKQIANARHDGDELTQEKAVLAQEKNALTTQKSALEASLTEAQTQQQTLDSQLKERDEEARRLQETYNGLLTDLKKEVQAGQVQVQQLRDGLRVNVAQDILFDSGSAEIDRNGIEVLTKVATQLRKSPHQIVVIGHTDNKPIGAALVKQYPSNWELAGARAASVVRLFTGTGLTEKRLLAVSMADIKPVASNATPEGRARNRRIEIRLRPMTGEV